MQGDVLNNILAIVQGGTSVVLAAILYLLWQEFKAQNAFIRDMLLKEEQDRATVKAALDTFNNQHSPPPP